MIVRYFGTQMASIIDVVNKKIITEKFKFNPLDTTTMKKYVSAVYTGNVIAAIL